MMSTSVEVVQEKSKLCISLWNDSLVSEYIKTAYATDGCMIDHGVTYKGHDEIIRIGEQGKGAKMDVISSNLSAMSDDCVVQMLTCKWGGEECHGKLTWKKIDGDWKITVAEWN